MFAKGEKIVCVDGKFPDAAKRLYKDFPVEGQVYTVRATYVGRGSYTKKDSGTLDGEIGVLLVEITNPVDPGLAAGLKGELGFRAERFAPVTPPIQEKHRAARPLRLPRPSFVPVPRPPELVPA